MSANIHFIEVRRKAGNWRIHRKGSDMGPNLGKGVSSEIQNTNSNLPMPLRGLPNSQRISAKGTLVATGTGEGGRGEGATPGPLLCESHCEVGVHTKGAHSGCSHDQQWWGE